MMDKPDSDNLSVIARARKPIKKRALAPIRSVDDPLSPQEELFVELYFQLGYDPRQAYARSIGRVGATTSTLASQSYRKLAEAPIQAAIMRRRAALRASHHATRKEKLVILESIMRDTSLDPRDRIRSVQAHNRMVGDDIVDQTPAREHERPTAGAIRQLSALELIATINRGLIPQARARMIDVTPIQHTNGTNGTNGKTSQTNGNGQH